MSWWDPRDWDTRGFWRGAGKKVNEATGLEQDDFSWLGSMPGGGVRVGTGPGGTGVGFGARPEDDPGTGLMNRDNTSRNRLLALLGGAGMKAYSENRAERRALDALKKQEQSQTLANIANILAPGSNVQARTATPKSAGFLEKLGRAGAVGADAYLQYDQMNQQEEARSLQNELTRSQIERNRSMTGASASGGGSGPKRTVGNAEGTFDALKNASRYGLDVNDVQLQDSVVESPYNTRRPARRPMTVGDLRDLGDDLPGQGYAAIRAGEEARKEAELERRNTESLIESRKPTPKIEHLSNLKRSAAEDAQNLGPDTAINIYADALVENGYDQTPEEMAQFIREVKPDLAEGATEKVARLASLETGINRIRKSIADIANDPEKQKALGFLQGSWEKVKAEVFAGSISDPEILSALNQMGITSEMAVRVFSGAAVTPEEFERYNDAFIGALRAGPEALMTHLDNLETEFRTQRTNIIGASVDPRSVGAESVSSEEDLVSQAELGSEEANRRLEESGYYERLAEQVAQAKEEARNIRNTRGLATDFQVPTRSPVQVGSPQRPSLPIQAGVGSVDPNLSQGPIDFPAPTPPQKFLAHTDGLLDDLARQHGGGAQRIGPNKVRFSDGTIAEYDGARDGWIVRPGGSS